MAFQGINFLFFAHNQYNVFFVVSQLSGGGEGSTPKLWNFTMFFISNKSFPKKKTKQNSLGVSSVHQLQLFAFLHQQSMTIVDGIMNLEGKDSICWWYGLWSSTDPPPKSCEVKLQFLFYSMIRKPLCEKQEKFSLEHPKIFLKKSIFCWWLSEFSKYIGQGVPLPPLQKNFIADLDELEQAKKKLRKCQNFGMTTCENSQLFFPKQPSDPDGAASKPTSSPCPGHLMVLGKHIFGFLLLKIFHIRLRNYKVLCNQINTIIKNILRMFWPPIKLKLFYFFMFNMLSK